MAYSSAIAVCGIGEHGLSFNESLLIYGLILIIVVMLSINYRGTKTIVAFSLVLIGGLLIVSGQLWGSNFLSSYTWASYLILLGVFLNSGLPVFIKSLCIQLVNAFHKKAKVKL
ncbi:MAG: hypothetical protein ACR2MX_12250 [Cyclobacteriaceae bacterium]